jgi:circadian clock protein KaiC
MSAEEDDEIVEKLQTGMSGFDIIAKGGLPKNRTTLVSGTAGSGKTVFAAQFLAAGIREGEGGVFVTFEETARDIRKNSSARNRQTFGFRLGIQSWTRWSAGACSAIR